MSDMYLSEFIFNEILLESPVIVDDIDKKSMNQTIYRMIGIIDADSTEIQKGMRRYKSPSGHIFIYHKNGNDVSNASIFRINGNDATHQIASKMDSRNPDGIYRNIQHMIDNGYVVSSDSKQSIGGRNLWNNMHHHVNYNRGWVSNETGSVDVPNFLDRNESDSSIFHISK